MSTELLTVEDYERLLENDARIAQERIRSMTGEELRRCGKHFGLPTEIGPSEWNADLQKAKLP